ncbi:nuclear transport factor 2 family protein [Paralcaligenes sp. KSB-10]|uniref:YybH family protein n=1 Tax=Paralcaligenes sp. KSB-10 TaxID=2901142 RepID=UPI001E4C89B6|nr:nuclear transport factor 2 family protein [Paralcaligenes sp. KSB-10]UHL62504.1 nuclear transport factor 2 family protein [Paralcaligenes sp. KSB-10]
MFATPEEAEHAFYDSLHQADTIRLMEVWSDDEEVVCVHPGGIRVIGSDSVRNSWQQILANGPLLIQPTRPMIMTSLMSSVHVLIEQVTIHSPEGKQVANCYTTNVYHKGPSGWRMVLHHASNAPDDVGMFDLQDIPGTLH